MARYESTFEVHSKTYAALFHTAWHLLDTAEKQKDGWLLNLQAATVFFAFTFEAYLNHVGAEEIAFWDEIEHISYTEKLMVLAKHLGFSPDKAKRPFQTINLLFRLRNDLAHGRTQKVKKKVISKMPPDHDAAWRVLPMEQITPQQVRRYHDDVRSAVECINTARPKSDQLVWNQGMRVFTINGPHP